MKFTVTNYPLQVVEVKLHRDTKKKIYTTLRWTFVAATAVGISVYLVRLEG